MDIPETRYARSGDVSIAYPVLGIAFRDRGSAALKGVPSEWGLFAVDATTT